MNEQIEKLFDRALEEFKAENKHATVVAPDTLQRDFLEKFAELIVRECVSVVDSMADPEDSDSFFWTIQNVSQKIKEHFGVEE